MTQRENVLRLLRCEEHSFVPVEFTLCPFLEEKLVKETGTPLRYEDYFEMPWRRLQLIPTDTSGDHYASYHPAHDDATEIDEWGVGHRSTPTSMHMTQMLSPLKEADSLEQIEAYPLPKYTEEANASLAEDIRALHERGVASLGNMQCTVWETSWYIRGMENLMMDMMSEDPMAAAILDKVTAMSLERALLFARAGVDMLFFGDDIGMQNSIMMNEELYRTWIQSRLAHIIREVKAVRPDLLIIYHSCGYVTPLIPNLIEAGIDVLNPVQPECMDFSEIYNSFGGQIGFHGTIGTQTTMPFGTPEEVRQTVFSNLKIAEKGGLFPAPTHLLEPDVPWENILAYAQACRDYMKS